MEIDWEWPAWNKQTAKWKVSLVKENWLISIEETDSTGKVTIKFINANYINALNWNPISIEVKKKLTKNNVQQRKELVDRINWVDAFKQRFIELRAELEQAATPESLIKIQWKYDTYKGSMRRTRKSIKETISSLSQEDSELLEYYVKELERKILEMDKDNQNFGDLLANKKGATSNAKNNSATTLTPAETIKTKWLQWLIELSSPLLKLGSYIVSITDASLYDAVDELIKTPENQDNVNYKIKNNNIVITWIKDNNWKWIGKSK